MATQQQLIEAHPGAVPAPAEAASILAVIDRAARSADVDVDKMERLFALQERIVAKQVEAEFNDALNRAQAHMGRIAADAINPQTRSRYATYAAIDRELRPLYIDAGLSLSFDTADSPQADHIRVLCHVSHVAGHTRTYHVDMPADGKGAKGGDVMTKTHAAGAAMSYGMRYLLKMIFNVAIGEDDNDGNSPPSPQPIKAPAGYDQWRADMQALADDGLDALKAAWARTDPVIRDHATRRDNAWWSQTKAAAGRVQP